MQITHYAPAPIQLPPTAIPFETMVLSPYLYAERLVYRIDHQGETQLLEAPYALLEHLDDTIKIEGMERYSAALLGRCRAVARVFNHPGPVTCHLFVARAGAPSFPTHTDPDTVFLYVVSGCKHLQVGEAEYAVSAGEALLIPAHVPHRALNHTPSTMLSFGLEHYLADKL